jgi:hypothetical protein
MSPGRAFTGGDRPRCRHPERKAFVAVLNGPWAITSPTAATRWRSEALRSADGHALDLDAATPAAQLPGVGGRLLVLVHDLCISDRAR